MTPLQKIIEFETSCSYMFDSDARIAMALLDYVRQNKHQFLKEERERLLINLMKNDEENELYDE